MTSRFSFDRDGRVITAPKRRRTNARKCLTVDAERIIAACYPGQVLAAVIERAVRQMVIRDGLLTPKTSKPRTGRNDP